MLLLLLLLRLEHYHQMSDVRQNDSERRIAGAMTALIKHRPE
jgi:hypothetical protein